MGLPPEYEYWEQAQGPAWLHVLLRLKSPAETKLIAEQLAALPGAAVKTHDRDCGEGCLMSLLFAAGAGMDQRLREIEALVGGFNPNNSGEGHIELLETRLVSELTPSPSAGEFQLSGRFQVVSGCGPQPLFDGANCETIILEPGLAFGSGRHPSSRLAVAALEEWAADQAQLAGCRVLDIGTGSGVLAIICGRLGAGQVLGLDICPRALEVAGRNIEANGLIDRVAVSNTPLAQISGLFDLIVANLTPAVLAGLLAQIFPRLAVSGTLIISGQMGRGAGELEQMLIGKGFGVQAAYSEGPWRALRLRLAGRDDPASGSSRALQPD